MELKVTKQSKRFDHCVNVYKAMLERAEYDSTLDQWVYTGYLTHMFNEIGYTAPQYSEIMANLKRMECVENIRRGSNSFPAMWWLKKEPTREAFDNAPPPEPKRISKGAARTIEQRIRDCERRLNALEAAQPNDVPTTQASVPTIECRICGITEDEHEVGEEADHHFQEEGY